MSGYIPPEIVRDILIKLPNRSLLRCTVVCKLWYNLITSSSFISSHLKLTLSNNENRLFIKIYVKDRISAVESDYYSVFCDTDNQSLNDIQKHECPFNTDNSYLHFNIVGSFNGLYCLSDDVLAYEEKIVLWNPSIRKSLTLPDPMVLCKSYGNYGRVLGFGFLPEINEYKIVRAVYLDRTDCWKAIPEVVIYSLSTGRWSDVDTRDCSHVIRILESRAFLNNCLHFGTYDWNFGASHRAIISINLKTEKFDTFMTPDIRNAGMGFSLSTFKDLLCLICCRVNEDAWIVWVMNEYGVESSWVKQFSIDSSEISRSIAYSKPLLFREMGDIILVGESKLVSYDPESKKEKNLWNWNHKKQEIVRLRYVDTYMESLVLLNVSNTTSSRNVDLDCQTSEESEIQEKFSQKNLQLKSLFAKNKLRIALID